MVDFDVFLLFAENQWEDRQSPAVSNWRKLETCRSEKIYKKTNSFEELWQRRLPWEVEGMRRRGPTLVEPPQADARVLRHRHRCAAVARQRHAQHRLTVLPQAAEELPCGGGGVECRSTLVEVRAQGFRFCSIIGWRFGRKTLFEGLTSLSTRSQPPRGGGCLGGTKLWGGGHSGGKPWCFVSKKHRQRSVRKRAWV